jgi:2TM domain
MITPNDRADGPRYWEAASALGKGGSVMSEVSTDALEDARRYVRRKRIFVAVLAIWVALSLMWLFIDLRDDSSSWWFYWPMFGTGTAVAITGIVLLGVGELFGADWERREIEKYLRRRGSEQDP